MTRPGVAVVGSYQTQPRVAVLDQSLEEMVFETSTHALLDAKLTLGEIDGIVLATSDQVQGRVIESMVTNGAAGGVGKDTTTIASSGEHALVYGALRLLAGQGRRILVLTWSKASESVDPQHADLVSAEPFFLRPHGMRSRVAAGLQASQYHNRYGVDRSALRALRDKRWADAADAYGTVPKQSGTDDLVAWPLLESDLPCEVDQACGVVLATENAVQTSHKPAWVTGLGWSTDRYELGERDLTKCESLEIALRRAIGKKPLREVSQVLELQEMTTVGSWIACESLGLWAAGSGAESQVSNQLPINPSGGNLPLNPGNAAGFSRLQAAADQVRGRMGNAQIHPLPSSAAGVALHGFAAQGAVVATFGTNPVDLTEART